MEIKMEFKIKLNEEKEIVLNELEARNLYARLKNLFDNYPINYPINCPINYPIYQVSSGSSGNPKNITDGVWFPATYEGKESGIRRDQDEWNQRSKKWEIQ